MSKIKISIITVFSIVSFVFVLIFGTGVYLVHSNLYMEHNGQNIEESYEYMRETYPWINHWLDSMQANDALRDTLIETEDGVWLHAIYAFAPYKTYKTAVIVHGYTDNSVRMLMIGQMYNESLGYNILLPDLRHSGLSEGDHIGMGWEDRNDVIEWIDVADKLFGDRTQTVVHGISMGAATVMMLSGEAPRASVKCYIEDCGYTSVWDEFKREMKKQYGLSSFPILNAADVYCKVRNGWCFHEASSIDAVSKSELPMFFIHGDCDDYVPTSMVFLLYDAKTEGKKDFWLVPATGHAQSFLNNREMYTEKVRGFTNKYIK